MKLNTILFLAVILSFSFYQARSQTSSSEFDKPISELSADLADLEGKKEVLLKKISDCYETTNTIKKSCEADISSGAIILTGNINQLKAELRTLEGKIGILKDNLARKAKSETDPAKILSLNKSNDDLAKLLSDKKSFDRDLTSLGLDAKSLYLKLDQTVLGNYAKYVAEKMAMSNETKSIICKTAPTCSAVQDLKKSTQQLKSFEDFKSTGTK